MQSLTELQNQGSRKSCQSITEAEFPKRAYKFSNFIIEFPVCLFCIPPYDRINHPIHQGLKLDKLSYFENWNPSQLHMDARAENKFLSHRVTKSQRQKEK